MEVWKKIRKYQRYSVSSHGRIRNDITGRILKPAPNKKGYLRLCLMPGLPPMVRRKSVPGKELKSDTVSVARMVAMEFKSNRKLLPEVNHLDGNKKNNKPNNLEWCTGSQNALHSYRTGLQFSRRGEDHHKARLTRKDILEIRSMWSYGTFSQKEIARKFGTVQGHISAVVRRVIWKHI